MRGSAHDLPLTRLAFARQPLPASRGEGTGGSLHAFLSADPPSSQRSAARLKWRAGRASSPSSRFREREGRGAPLGASSSRCVRCRTPRLAALHSGSGECLSAFAQLRFRACVSRDEPGRQRAPRTRAVVPKERFPKPPGCELARLARGRRASRGGFPLWPPDLSAHLRARLRPAPRSRRLMRAPLGEQGEGMIPQDSRPGINSHVDVNDPRVRRRIERNENGSRSGGRLSSRRSRPRVAR